VLNVSANYVSEVGQPFSLYNSYQPSNNMLGEKRAFINQSGVNLDQ
jgi:hypothetical protein